MNILKKPSLEETRLKTYTTIRDIVRQIEKLQEKTTKEKYKEYLKKLHDEFYFSINNNTKIPSKLEKKLFDILDDIDSLLNHELWNSNRIKKRLNQIDDLKREIL